MYSLISGNKDVTKAIQQFPLYCDEIKSEEDFLSFSEIVKQATINFDIPIQYSPYNIHVSKKGKHFVYNSLTNALYCFENDEEYYKVAHCKSNSIEIRRLFISDGLWVDAKKNIIEYFLKFIETSHLYWKHHISIVLTTTLECNARCFYCYEAGVKHGSFNLEKIDDLINFIHTLDLSKGMQLVWFGGEPLLNTKFMDVLSSRLKQENIPFVSYLVTNGSLLTNEIIETKFYKWNVTEMQVTIDGTEDAYERIKAYSGNTTHHYEHIMSMLQLASNKKINVNIRMNFSKCNIHNLYELLEELEARFSKQEYVSFYPAFLTGIKDYIPENERLDIIKNILRIIKNPSKISFHSKFYSLPKISPCHRFSDKAFAIDVNGDIYTCEHNVGRKEKAIGNISTGLFHADTRHKMPPLRQECKECRYLPKCCGGCDSNYKNGDIACMIEKYMIQGYLEFLLDK